MSMPATTRGSSESLTCSGREIELPAHMDHPGVHVNLGPMQAEDFPRRIAVSPTAIVAIS